MKFSAGGTCWTLLPTYQDSLRAHTYAGDARQSEGASNTLPGDCYEARTGEASALATWDV